MCLLLHISKTSPAPELVESFVSIPSFVTIHPSRHSRCDFSQPTNMASVVNTAKKGNLRNAPVKQENLQLAREEAPEIPYVNWRKDPGLRKLYLYCIVICVASATTGYDGYVPLSATFSSQHLNRSSNDSVQIHVEQPAYHADLGEILRHSQRLKPRYLDSSLQYWQHCQLARRVSLYPGSDLDMF